MKQNYLSLVVLSDMIILID